MGIEKALNNDYKNTSLKEALIGLIIILIFIAVVLYYFHSVFTYLNLN